MNHLSFTVYQVAIAVVSEAADGRTLVDYPGEWRELFRVYHWRPGDPTLP